VDVRWAAGALVLSFLFVGLLIAFTRRQRQLDRLQAHWGWLGPTTYPQGGGRAWAGEFQGRQIQARWVEGSLELEVDAQPLVEAVFVRRGQPAQLAGVIGGTSIELGRVAGYGRDTTALEAIGRHLGARGALSILLGGDDRSLCAVRLQPDRGISWVARGLPETELAPEYAQVWVEALVVLARLSEEPPCPPFGLISK
jgi:hypothetical protein